MDWREVALEGSDGNLHKLGDFKGIVVLYFYPKDDTPGCTIEAKEFSTLAAEFEKLGVKVVGVSADDCESHKKFVNKHNLSILLLSDPDKKLINHFGVWGKKKLYGKEFEGIIRSTFVLKDGVVVKEWRSVNPKGHAEKVLEFIRSLA